jgi:hypothetical protein
MKTKQFTFLTLSLIALLNLNSCNESSPPPLSKDTIQIESVTLTAFDFNNPNNIYEGFMVGIYQEQGAETFWLHNPGALDCEEFLDASDLPHEMLCEIFLDSDDIDNNVKIMFIGIKENSGDLVTLGVTQLTPDQILSEDSKTFTFNGGSSTIPFTLVIKTNSF